MNALIEVKALNFSYGENRILEDISFVVNEGDYLGIIGPNGGGKTTLIKILLGLLPPTSGTVSLLGEASTERHHRASLGYVPQRVSLPSTFFPATVEEIVQTGRISEKRWLRSLSEKDKQYIEEAMEVVKIKELRHRLIHELSGGQRQRVFIARALARHPRVLILDEPTVGVDIAAQKEFYDFLKKLNQENGLAIVLVSHDIDVIAKQVHKILCLNGRMVCHTNTEDFIDKDFLKELYGEDTKFIVHH